MRLIVRSMLDARYFTLKYDNVQLLKNWLTFSKGEPLYNFALVELRNGKETILKTSKGKNFVLKIKSVSFIGFDNLVVSKDEKQRDSLEDRVKQQQARIQEKGHF